MDLKHIKSLEMSANCIMFGVLDLLLSLYLKYVMPRKILTMTVHSAKMSETDHDTTLLLLPQTPTATESAELFTAWNKAVPVRLLCI